MKSTKIQIITLFMLLTTCFSSVAQNQQNTLKVQGIGRVAIEDIQGVISASIITNAELPDEAISTNSAKVQAVVSTLNSVGISDNNIQTANFSFHPHYISSQGQTILDGYRVSSILTITANENTEIGPILDLIIAAGVTEINDVKFNAIDIQLLNRQALRKATQDAKTKAQVLASASSVSLGKVIKIDNTKVNFNGIATAAGVSPSINTAILSGINYITANVTIEYLIE